MHQLLRTAISLLHHDYKLAMAGLQIVLCLKCFKILDLRGEALVSRGASCGVASAGVREVEQFGEERG